jgi:hypothetical protein
LAVAAGLLMVLVTRPVFLAGLVAAVKLTRLEGQVLRGKEMLVGLAQEQPNLPGVAGAVLALLGPMPLVVKQATAAWVSLTPSLARPLFMRAVAEALQAVEHRVLGAMAAAVLAGEILLPPQTGVQTLVVAVALMLVAARATEVLALSSSATLEANGEQAAR